MWDRALSPIAKLQELGHKNIRFLPIVSGLLPTTGFKLHLAGKRDFAVTWFNSSEFSLVLLSYYQRQCEMISNPLLLNSCMCKWYTQISFIIMSNKGRLPASGTSDTYHLTIHNVFHKLFWSTSTQLINRTHNHDLCHINPKLNALNEFMFCFFSRI